MEKYTAIAFIPSLMLVPTALAMANTAPGDGEEDPPASVNENAPPVDPEVIYELLPDDALLPRSADEWASQYDSEEEFENAMTLLREFPRSAEGNDWNNAHAADHYAVHNFDTITGEIGNAHEVAALVISKQKLAGTYGSPDEPVRKFHEWLAEEYSTPSTIAEIEQKITTLTNNVTNHQSLAEQATAAFNDMAARGAVPDELFSKDWNYWNIVMGVAICADLDGCDQAEMQSYLDTRGWESSSNEESSTLQDTSWWEVVFPYAYASHIVDVSHTQWAWGSAPGCGYESCWSSSYTSQTGYDDYEHDGDAASIITVKGGATACVDDKDTVWQFVSATATLSGIDLSDSDSDSDQGANRTMCAQTYVSDTGGGTGSWEWSVSGYTDAYMKPVHPP